VFKLNKTLKQFYNTFTTFILHVAIAHRQRMQFCDAFYVYCSMLQLQRPLQQFGCCDSCDNCFCNATTYLHCAECRAQLLLQLVVAAHQLRQRWRIKHLLQLQQQLYRVFSTCNCVDALLQPVAETVPATIARRKRL